MPKARGWDGGWDGGAGQPVGLTTDEGSFDGPAGALCVAEAGGALVAVPSEVVVADGGCCVAVAELPLVAGGLEVVGVESGVAVSVALEDAGPLGGTVVLGEYDGLGDVVSGTGAGLVAGRGCGALGRSSV